MRCVLMIAALIAFVVSAARADDFTWGEPADEPQSYVAVSTDTVGNWSEPWPVAKPAEPAPVLKKLAFAEWYNPAAQISFQEKMNRQSLIGNREIERTKTVTVPVATQAVGWSGQASGCSGASSYSRSAGRFRSFSRVRAAGGG